MDGFILWRIHRKKKAASYSLLFLDTPIIVGSSSFCGAGMWLVVGSNLDSYSSSFQQVLFDSSYQ
jgi:hypothetical protein